MATAEGCSLVLGPSGGLIHDFFTLVVFLNHVSRVCFALLLSFAEAFSLSLFSFSHSDFSVSGVQASVEQIFFFFFFLVRCILCSRTQEAEV